MNNTTNKPRKSTTGRLIIASLWTVVAIYLTVVILGGLARSLFGTPPSLDGTSADARGAERAWCVRQVRGLRDELEARVSQSMQNPNRRHADRDHWQAWEKRFDQRTTEARSRCADDDEFAVVFNQLAELRQAYHDGMTAVLHARDDLSAGLDQSLQRLLPHKGSP